MSLCVCVQGVVPTPDVCHVSNTRGPYVYQMYKCLACVEEQVRDRILAFAVPVSWFEW